MKSRGVRAAGASLFIAALVGAAGTSVAAAAPGIAVSELSSLKAGAQAGTLHGRVVNDGAKARFAKVTVRLLKRGVRPHVVGSTSVLVGAGSSTAYAVKVAVPSGLPKGDYYFAACTPLGKAANQLSCATAVGRVKVKGGTPALGSAVRAANSKVAHASAEACTSGSRSLSAPGTRVYPETGNGGYRSTHTDVFMVYDPVANTFLPGNHVDLTQVSTQCLSDFSLDFERTNSNAAGPNMDVQSVLINGQPATFRFAQPTYPGDPNGVDDPDPLAHRASLVNPVSAANPNPPACTPTGTAVALNDQPCPATKLVITPAAPIASGTTFKVTVNYTGRPGVHVDGDSSTEGWFRNNNPVGDGGFVTTEPLGTMAWMPLNNHPSVKPTYDFHDQIPAPDPAAPDGDPAKTGRVVIANGELNGFTDNAPDANFPAGSRTYNWHSPEGIASYLVENTVGYYDPIAAINDAAGTVYYQYQAHNVPAANVANNLAIFHKQQDISDFQAAINGVPFPFTTDGAVVGLPGASFEEEMQTKITFANGSLGGSNANAQTLAHENMHQWFGDNVSEGSYNLTFWKEGFATLGEYYYQARAAATTAGGLGTPAGDAAFEASLVSRFNGTGNYNTNSSTFWSVAPSNPTANVLFSPSAYSYTRPGTAYIALRAILGKANFAKATADIQNTYRQGSITEPQEEAIFHKWIPNQSASCSAKLDAFFKQWWDTAYTGSPAAGNKPQITGPGLAGRGFYDTDGGCSDYAVGSVGGTVAATLSLTLGTPATFGTFTPGVANTYTAQTTATVISTAGDAALSIADPSSTAPGHLVNGAFSLPSALQASAASAGGTTVAGGDVSGSPRTLLTWAAPISNDAVTVAFKQPIAANDALRTGSYSKTLTFTLSTTTP